MLPLGQKPDSGQTAQVRDHLTGPPLQGYLLWRLYELMEDKLKGKAFLKELYPKILAYHRYLYHNRDPEEEGVVYIRHPWESGVDPAPVWDALLKTIDINELRQTQFQPEKKESPFRVQDPFYNACLVWSNECLIKVGAVLKEDILEIIQWNELTIYSLNDKLWDEERGIYNAFDLNANSSIPITSISGLLPMIGEVPTQDQAECILCTLESSMFGGKSKEYHLCPTNSLNTDTLNFQSKWRGSVNLVANWMLLQSLLRYDMVQMARRVKSDTLNLCSKYGFYEHYDARKMHFRPIGYGREEDLVSAAICVDLLTREVEVGV